MILITVAIASILATVACSLIIIADLFSHPQKMGIMNIVWPVTALYSGPLGLIAYYMIGRAEQNHYKLKHPQMKRRPFWQSVLTGAFHCGSGCTLGDLIAVNLIPFFPLIIFGRRLYGEWLIDLVLAFFIGIVFQYYAIKPMKQLSTGKAIIAALKADTLSLLFWQIGMYGWMAISDFLIFHRVLTASDPVFWLMMQIAMLAGLITAYPVNWWLIKKDIKEAM